MLQALLHDGALFPVFQPVVDLRQGTVFGYAALIRGPVDTPLHAPMALLALAAAESRLVEFELHCVEVTPAAVASVEEPGTPVREHEPGCGDGGHGRRAPRLA